MGYWDPPFQGLIVLTRTDLAEEEGSGCFTLIVFLLSCECMFSVSLPHSAVSWSAVRDCGIS